MKAWRVHRAGEPGDVLVLDEIAEPRPGPTQMRARVLASSVNFPDALMCRGEYQVRPDLPFTPGIELCGEITEVGSRVTGLAVGDRVIGGSVLPRGGFAEFALMDEMTTFRAPVALDDAEASALYIGYQTGWFGLVRRAGLRAGETLLVHAAAGGVGSAAIQIGRALGARVIGVVRGAEKAEVARKLGADVVVDRLEQDFVQVVKDETGGRGADVIYDPVGGDAYERSTKCVAFEGRVLVVGFAGGQIQTARLNHALIKNYSIVGLHWGLYAQNDPGSLSECHRELDRLIGLGMIRPFVSRTVPLGELADAVQDVADGKTVGRLAWVV